MIISPKEPVTQTIARVGYTETEVWLRFTEYNDAFRAIVKTRRYTWSHTDKLWLRQTESSRDRCLEIAQVLLENGFIIDIDTGLVGDLQSRNFKREVTKWITANDNAFVFHWYRSEDVYHEIMKLPAAWYCKPYVCVPMEYYKDVADFAVLNGFTINQDARQMLTAAETALNAVLFWEDSVDTVEPFAIDNDLLD